MKKKKKKNNKGRHDFFTSFLSSIAALFYVLACKWLWKRAEHVYSFFLFKTPFFHFALPLRVFLFFIISFLLFFFERTFTTDFKDETKQRKGWRGRKAGTCWTGITKTSLCSLYCECFFPFALIPFFPFRNYVFSSFFLLLFFIWRAITHLFGSQLHSEATHGGSWHLHRTLEKDNEEEKRKRGGCFLFAKKRAINFLFSSLSTSCSSTA